MAFDLLPEHLKILEEIKQTRGHIDQIRTGSRSQKDQASPSVAPASQGQSDDSVNRLPARHDLASSGGLSGDHPVAAPNSYVATPVPPERVSSSDPELLACLQGADLMRLLGFVNVTEHGLEIRLYYLLGWAYHHGARSGRQILKLLASPPPEFLASDLAMRVRKSLRINPKKLFTAIAKLEELLKTPLVIDLGGGLPFAGLTEVGEAFWRVVAEYLREHL